MTRILVVSDTHGDIRPVCKVLETCGKFDYIFNLGDKLRDAEQLAALGMAEVVAVKGNCDFGSGDTVREVFIGGKKLVLTHGHGQNVKYGLTNLAYFAQEREADAVFYGHTHVPGIEYAEGILLMNPGSMTLPRSGRPTYGVVTISEKGVAPAILEYNAF